jgi:hypothetical protein
MGQMPPKAKLLVSAYHTNAANAINEIGEVLPLRWFTRRCVEYSDGSLSVDCNTPRMVVNDEAFAF